MTIAILIKVSCIKTINVSKLCKVYITLIISTTHLVKDFYNHNATHRTSSNSFLSCSNTSRLSNVSITLRVHIYTVPSFFFCISHKVSNLSDIISHLSVKKSNISHLLRISIFTIINKKNTVSSHFIYFIFTI